MPWFLGVHFKLSHPVIASLRSNPEGNIILSEFLTSKTYIVEYE